MDIPQLKKELDRKVLELEILEADSSKLTIAIAQNKHRIEILEKCRLLILQVGNDTQNELKNIIESTVTLALQSVYGFKYKFMVKFNYDKRDQLEVSFFIDKNGLILEPRKDTVGYGLVDICSFSLRMVMWMLGNPQTHAIMIMDEPFKNIRPNMIIRAYEMVKQISEMLSMQFIIATHIDEMIENADTVHQIGEGDDNV